MVHRVILGRLIVITRTTTSNFVFYCCYAVDLMTIILMVVGWMEWGLMSQHCSINYYVFYLLVVMY